MPLRVSEVRVPVDGGDGVLLARALRKAGLNDEDVTSLEVVRRSIDRRRAEPVFSFTVDLHLADESRGCVAAHGVERVAAPSPPEIPMGEEPLEHPPVVVGTGPAGMFAALYLAQRGFRPIVLERGDRMNHRVAKIRDLNRDGALDPESNYLFGEGGAGTFSDGKLTSRSKDPRARWVLREFRDRSGVPSVTWDHRPHLGSDRVRTVVGRIRQEILSLGGEIRFRCRVDRLRLRDGRVTGVVTSAGDVPAAVVVLAPGHSARDLYRALHQQEVAMVPKAFQLGFRVEHPQSWVDTRVWGRFAGKPELGPADYRLAVKARGAGVYSFCMCPGGEIIPAISDVGHMNTNGMSWSSRATGFANSGLVTTLEPESFPGEGPLAGVFWQERLEAHAAALAGGGLAVPAQRLQDWIQGRPSDSLPSTSCRTGLVPAPLRSVVPEQVDRLVRDVMGGIERQMPGFLQEEALLVGPESRSSAPVRLVRDPRSLESPGTEGLLPVGEGAGYAGGIVSAAVDGLRAAEVIVARYRA